MRRPSSFGIGPHSEAHAACAEAPAAARTRPAAESRLRSEPTPRPLRRSDIPAVPFPPLFPWRAFNHRWKEMDKFPAEHPLRALLGWTDRSCFALALTSFNGRWRQSNLPDQGGAGFVRGTCGRVSTGAPPRIQDPPTPVDAEWSRARGKMAPRRDSLSFPHVVRSPRRVAPTPFDVIMSPAAVPRSRVHGILSSVSGLPPLHCARMTLRLRSSSMPRRKVGVPRSLTRAPRPSKMSQTSPRR